MSENRAAAKPGMALHRSPGLSGSQTIHLVMAAFVAQLLPNVNRIVRDKV
jgi:hypothetical protein